MQRIIDLFQNHILTFCLAVGLCVGVGFVIGLVVFRFAEPYSLVVDARVRVAWIAATVGSIIGCSVVILYGLEPNLLTFTAFLIFGALVASLSGLLPLTFGLSALRRVAGISKTEFSRSHSGRERLKD